MFNSIQWVAFYTLMRKEVVRFFRIWGQTLVPAPVTTTLYFLIFGNLIGSQIAPIAGASYIEYIAPGLIMMSIITNSYANVVASFFGIKFQKSIEELYVAPISGFTIMMGFCLAGVTRGVTVGLLVALTASIFVKIHVVHVGACIVITLLTAMLFSQAGLLNALYAKKFDDVNIVPVFILSPLTYLGGVFYSIKMLPPFWEQVSYLNPILYMINAFRYSMIGSSDIAIEISLILIMSLVIVLGFINLRMLNKGFGVRT